MWVINKQPQGDGFYSWTVGYYVPGGAISPRWVAIKDCSSLDEAMDLAHYLNGGNK